MIRSAPRDRVERLLREHVARAARMRPEEVGADDDLFLDLGLDSLQGLQLLAALELRCGVRFEDRELGRLTTIRRLLDRLEQRAREEVAP